jgi:hypothetical protein
MCKIAPHFAIESLNFFSARDVYTRVAFTEDSAMTVTDKTFASFQDETRRSFKVVHSSHEGLRSEFTGLRSEFDGLRSELQAFVVEVRASFKKLEKKIDTVDNRVSEMDSRFRGNIFALSNDCAYRYQDQMKALHMVNDLADNIMEQSVDKASLEELSRKQAEWMAKAQTTIERLQKRRPGSKPTKPQSYEEMIQSLEARGFKPDPNKTVEDLRRDLQAKTVALQKKIAARQERQVHQENERPKD